MIEIQGFGWNALTVSFVFTMLAGFIGAVALTLQIVEVWKKKSGESLRVTFLVSMVALFLSFLDFGWEVKSIAMISQFFFRFPFMLILLVLLFLHEGFGRYDWTIVFSFLVVLVGMFFSESSGYYFLAFNFIGVWFSGEQAWEI